MPARTPPTSTSPATAAAPDGPAPRGQPVARWFLALRPEPPARLALERQARGLAALRGGRAVPAQRIHLTLVFIGVAPRALEAPLRALVRSLPPPGSLVLERIGSFDGRLLWLGPAGPCAWLEATSAAARAGLDALGVPFDRKPFRAHATLVRDARPTRGEALAALAADVRAVRVERPTLHLVESSSDARGLHYRFL